MKPLEVERPWIKRKLGLKMLGSVIVVFIITFAILALFGFYDGGTINVQSINVSFSDQKIKTYSYAYGKETFSTGKKIVMNIQFNDNGINSTVDITGVKSMTSGFSATLDKPSVQILKSGETIPVVVTMPA
ncbi:MAG: hypothetical protein MPI47_09760, partial [Cuniculiplasma sp.]|nr:hypothetical protein [Cuniculiplasma sp.]